MKFTNLQKLDPIDQRIPEWNPFPDKIRHCPFCGEYSDPLLLRPDRLPISHCNKCKCFYVSLRISEVSLNAYYDRYWTDACPRPLTDEMAKYLQCSALDRAASDYCLLKLGALLGQWKDQKVLDVGCGFGEKATMMQSLGASVIGLDISAEAIAFMDEKLKIPVYRSTVESFSGHENYFDLIAMFEYIEHILEPCDAVRAAVEKMKTGGLLAIVSPNGTEGERYLNHNAHWAGFCAELEHMQYLHAETISYMAIQFGLRIVHLEQSGFRSAQASPISGNTGCPSSLRIKRWIKKFPGIRRAVFKARHYQARLESMRKPRDETGNYHLFAVLQKIA